MSDLDFEDLDPQDEPNEKREPRPCWMYRPLDGRTTEGKAAKERGERYESRLFQHPDDVPDGEGWVDSPADLG